VTNISLLVPYKYEVIINLVDDEFLIEKKCD